MNWQGIVGSKNEEIARLTAERDAWIKQAADMEAERDNTLRERRRLAIIADAIQTERGRLRAAPRRALEGLETSASV
jgi:hypothetical protein